MGTIKKLSELQNLKGKRVILRLDWNVDDKYLNRIEQTRIPYTFRTIEYLQKQGARIIIITHRGRPNGKPSIENSLVQLVTEIISKYKLQYHFVNFSITQQYEDLESRISEMHNGEVVVLENIRFYTEEKNNDLKFAEKIAQLGDIYVNDAFAVCHREHASVHAITNYLPSYGGFIIENEIANLNKAVNPKGNSVAIFGGAKLDTKLQVIEELGSQYNAILCGSVLAHVFYAIQDISYGTLKFELDEKIYSHAEKLFKKYKKKIILPVDGIVAQEISPHAKVEHRNLKEFKSRDLILDIGPKSVQLFAPYIKKADTLLWNGPLGYFEIPATRHGTTALMTLMASRSKGKAFGVAGGGETLTAINHSKLEDSFDFISTGGGAMLEYLYNKTLPCIEKLK